MKTSKTCTKIATHDNNNAFGTFLLFCLFWPCAELNARHSLMPATHRSPPAPCPCPPRLPARNYLGQQPPNSEACFLGLNPF